ncbi:MAG: transposase family protein [Streptosporangiaceae bacterium]
MTFTAGIQVAPATLDHLTKALQAAHARKGTHYRKLDVGTQALVTVVYLRTNLTYAELAHGYGVDASTMWRNVGEGIAVLAGRAIRLRDVLRLARKMGWEYLLLDGTLISTVAFGRKIAAKQPHYSGKHKRHGVNIQTVCAPDGTLLWASAALPGKTHDVAAYRAHQLQQRLAGDFATLADLGYKGAGAAITGYKKPRGGHLTPAQKAANAVHAALRSPGERGNAQLKWWRVLATEMRCRPGRCTIMVKACLTLHHLEVQPFAAPQAA